MLEICDFGIFRFLLENRVETAALLLDSGADPFAKSKNGDDALQIACLKGFHDIYRLLTSRIKYSTERLANANELIGNDEINNCFPCPAPPANFAQ